MWNVTWAADYEKTSINDVRHDISLFSMHRSGGTKLEWHEWYINIQCKINYFWR